VGTADIGDIIGDELRGDWRHSGTADDSA
jgi:hypothetical protein